MSRQPEPTEARSGWCLDLINKVAIAKRSFYLLLALLTVSVPQGIAGNGSTGKGLSLSAVEYRKLTAINADIRSGHTALARRALLNPELEKYSPYTQALGWQMLGALDVSAQRWSEARENFVKALSFEALPSAAKLTIHGSLMRVNHQLKDWQSSLYYWDLWIKKPLATKRVSVNANDYLRATDSYKALMQWHNANKMLNKAMSITAQPPSQWYQLQWSIQRHLKTAKQSISLLKKLIVRFPKREDYWVELAVLYQNQGQHRASSALLNSAFINGALIQPGNIFWLAKSLSTQGNAAAAAQIIEKAIEEQLINRDEQSQKILVHCYIRAKMFKDALRIQQKRVAVVPSPSGYEQLAQLYFKLQRWQLAYDTALKTVAVNEADTIELQLLLATSSFNLKQFLRADGHFAQVLSIEPNNVVAQLALKRD